MKLEQCSLNPAVAASVVDAHIRLAEDGAVIINSIGPDVEDACGLAYQLFGDEALAVPPAARVFDGGEMDNKGPGIDHTTRLAAHTDGFGYGDFYPDYTLLDCVNASDAGGESFLIDGYELPEALNTGPATAWVPNAMAEVAVNQTEEGMQASVSPIVQYTATGRRWCAKR